MDSGYLAFFCIVYTLIIIGVGLWQSRDTGDSSADYYLAGRGLTAWASAFSGAASAESGWVMLGLVGTAYTAGVSAFWVLPGSVLGYLFSWLWLAPRLRASSERTGAVTLPEVLANEHPPQKRLIQLLGAGIVLLFLSVYVSAQFNAVGKTLDSMFGIPYHIGVLIGMGVIFAYVISGGFSASVWTDVLQAVFMVFALVILPVFLYFSQDISLSVLPPVVSGAEPQASFLDPMGGKLGFGAFGFLMGWLGIGFGYLGQPHMLVRYMATKSDKELKQAALIATVWTTFVLGGAVLLGLVARYLLPGLADPEKALTETALHFLPLPLAALVLAAVLAAICSTADSQLLVVSSAVSNDIAQSDKTKGKSLGRWTVFGVGVVGALIAASESKVIFDLVLYAFAALGCSFGPALIGTFSSKRVSGYGVISGMIGGTLTVIIWSSIPLLKGLIYEMVPAFFIALFLTFVVMPHKEDRN